MSKKSKDIIAQSSYETGYLVFDYNVRELEGKILTLLEMLGLNDVQLKAAKSGAREIIYIIYNQTWMISPKVVEEIINRKEGVSEPGVSLGNGMVNVANVLKGE